MTPKEKLPKMTKIRDTEIFQNKKSTSVISEFCKEKTTMIVIRISVSIVFVFIVLS